ncbi:unnamed protein product [Rhizophagus irregularis]|nr:unnamed protein product [Rhizophagus irregularis]
MDSLKPTKEFEQAIEEALNRKSLKNILQNLTPITFGDVNDVNKILIFWFRNINNHLEIVKFDNIIPSYKILKAEQQRKIDDILKNNFKIIMTGITDLADLNNNNVENYKRIEFGLSVGSENYEVFGSTISENNTKLEEIYVNFGLYDFKGFYAIIKKVEETSIDITKCYVSWMIIGKPSQLSVFSPKNRELQVDYIKKSIKLQSNEFNYVYEPNKIVKLVEWKERSIIVQIESAYKIKSNASSLNSDHEDNDCLTNEVDLRICILSTNYKSLKVDNAKERECPLDLIGHILNEKNFNRNLFNESTKNEVSVNIRDNDFIASQSLNIQLEPNDKVSSKTIDISRSTEEFEGKHNILNNMNVI